jgi:hypothetical protein
MLEHAHTEMCGVAWHGLLHARACVGCWLAGRLGHGVHNVDEHRESPSDSWWDDTRRVHETCASGQLTGSVRQCVGARGGRTAGLAFNGRNRKKEEDEQAARAAKTATAPARNIPSLARWLASPVACVVARWRTRRSPSARRPGHPQMSGEGRSSPRWLLAEVKASVKRGGVARRRGRRCQRRRGYKRQRCAR